MEDKVRQGPELTGYGKGSDIILNTTGSHLRTLVKEARVIVSYFKKMSSDALWRMDHKKQG